MTKKLFIVDTICTFRHKYVIECDDLTHAYDEVTMKDSSNPADDFSEVTQRYLGETIIDGREITKGEFDALMESYKTDKNELASYWMGDKLIRKIDYSK